MESLSYKFVAGGILTASKTALYRTYSRDSAAQTGGSASIGVHLSGMQDKTIQTSLSLGTNEKANDIKMEEAFVTVVKTKKIVATQLVGMSGTIKEHISDGDFALTIVAGLVATDENGVIVDRYPKEGIEKLCKLLDFNKELYVNSEFLGMFGIVRMVVKNYTINQMTHSNHQTVTITADSDEDYIIKNEEF